MIKVNFKKKLKSPKNFDRFLVWFFHIDENEEIIGNTNLLAILSSLSTLSYRLKDY